MPYHNTSIIRGSIEIEIEVEFNFTSLGSSASWYDPGDPAEWDVDKITTKHAGIVIDYDDLSDEEMERLDKEICEGDYLQSEIDWRSDPLR